VRIKKMRLKKKDKKAVSMMISYVILITIAIAMAITIYAWLKLVANVEPLPDCGEGTSIVINDYVCGNDKLRLSLKNNGRFTIDGFTIQIGNNPEREPITHLLPFSSSDFSVEGYFVFFPPLAPGESRDAVFGNKEKTQDGREIFLSYEEIVNLKIQPYIFYESEGIKQTKIFCAEGVIKQAIQDCNLGAEV